MKPIQSAEICAHKVSVGPRKESTLRNLPHIYTSDLMIQRMGKRERFQSRGYDVAIVPGQPSEKEEGKKSSSVVIFLCEYSTRIMNCPTKRIKTFFMGKRKKCTCLPSKIKAFFPFLLPRILGGRKLCVCLGAKSFPLLLFRHNFVSQVLVAGCLGSHGPSSMRRRKGMGRWWDGDERCKKREGTR